MTNHVVRLYALAATLAVFFVTWAVIAVRPWTSDAAAPSDPQVAQLQRREQQLRERAAEVQRILSRGTGTAAQQIADAPPPAPDVRVVTLPPVTTTRSS